MFKKLKQMLFGETVEEKMQEQAEGEELSKTEDPSGETGEDDTGGLYGETEGGKKEEQGEENKEEQEEFTEIQQESAAEAAAPDQERLAEQAVQSGQEILIRESLADPEKAEDQKREPEMQADKTEEEQAEKRSSEEGTSEEEASEEETPEKESEEAKREEESPIPEVVEEEPPQIGGKGLFARLKEGLSKTAQSLTGRLDQLFQGHIEIDEELYEEIEEILITADVGFDTTLRIVEQLRNNIRKKSIQDVPAVKEELKAVIAELLVSEESRLSLEPAPAIMVIVGVNGVGKTTSIGKIAMKLRREGKSVMLAAADTFRAAAAEQLSIWADRAGVDIVKHQEGADPSAVIFDAIQKAKANKVEVLICDTAGRLHNKKNLMQELSKIFRIIEREYPQAKREVLLVIDATTGQNAVTQAKLFKEAAPLDGIILTKLDGTAKGGVVLSIRSDLQIPIKLIGVGEKIEDLQDFDAESFARALFENGEE